MSTDVYVIILVITSTIRKEVMKSFSYLLAASWTLLSPVRISAMSSLLVKTSGTKCVVVEAGMDVVLMVDYEAPGECIVRLWYLSSGLHLMSLFL